VTKQAPTWNAVSNERSYQDSFTALATQHQAWIQACCRSMGISECDLEDVTSNVLLKAYKGLPGFAGRASLRSWLWKIMHHEVINHFRKAKRQNREGTCIHLRRDHTHIQDPASLMEQQDTHQILDQALNQLPRPWATSLRLFYWQHQSTRSIADVLKVKPSVVRAYLFRGRNRLRQLLPAG
jgi:RNA polymerase sigma-70 factor, ECF subfamily